MKVVLDPLKINIEVNKAEFEKQLKSAETFARDTKKAIDQNMKIQLEFNIANFQSKLQEVKGLLKNATGDSKVTLQVEANQLQRGLTESKRQLNNLVNTGDASTSRLQQKFDKLGNDMSGSMTTATQTIGQRIDTMGKSIGETFTRIGLAITAVIYAYRQISGFLGSIISEGQDAIRTEKQLNNLLEQTGKNAEITTEQVIALADATSKKTGIDDEALIRLSTTALKFQNISGKILPELTQAVIDLTMAENGGLIPTQEELINNAQKLGFILNDPIAGYKKLRAIGISFTEAEKEQIQTSIKAGKGFEVQAQLLAKLGGIYKNAGLGTDELTRSTAILNVAWNNMKENLGKAIIPRLATFVSSLNTVGEAIFNLNNQIAELGGVKGVVKKTRMTLKAVVTGKPLTIAEQQYYSGQPKLITDTTKTGTAKDTTKNSAQTEAQSQLDAMNKLFEQYSVKAGGSGGAGKISQATKDAEKAVEDMKDTFKSAYGDINSIVDESKGKIADYKTEIADLNTEIGKLTTTRDEDLAKRVSEIDKELAKTGEQQVSAEERLKLEKERAEAFIGLTQAETTLLQAKIVEQEKYDAMTDVGKIKADYDAKKLILEQELKDKEELLKQEEALYIGLKRAKLQLEADYTTAFKGMIEEQKVAVSGLISKYNELASARTANALAQANSTTTNNTTNKTTTVNATVSNPVNLNSLVNKLKK